MRPTQVHQYNFILPELSKMVDTLQFLTPFSFD